MNNEIIHKYRSDVTKESKRPLECALSLRSAICSLEGQDDEQCIMLPLLDTAIGILYEIAGGLDMTGGVFGISNASFAPVEVKRVRVETRDDLIRLSNLIADEECPSHAFEKYTEGEDA